MTLVRQAGRTDLGPRGLEALKEGVMTASTIVAPASKMERKVEERADLWDSTTVLGMRREDHCRVPLGMGGKRAL